MTTELTIPTRVADINKAFGFESSKPKPVIPVLKINGADADDEASAPKGTFVYDDGERVLYAKDATIRCFLKGLQYRLYHPKEKAKNDVSIIGTSFRNEFRSTSGKIACGKMPKKDYEALGHNVTPAQKELQETVKCKLIIFGLVSGEFTDAETKQSVTLKDELFIWVTSQAAFMPMDAAITGIERERRAVPCTEMKLTLDKKKNGSVTYFVPVAAVSSDTVQLDPKVDLPKLEQIKKYVTDTNRYVDEKYNAALNNRNMDNSFEAVGKVIGGNDMDDSIPF